MWSRWLKCWVLDGRCTKHNQAWLIWVVNTCILNMNFSPKLTIIITPVFTSLIPACKDFRLRDYWKFLITRKISEDHGILQASKTQSRHAKTIHSRSYWHWYNRLYCSSLGYINQPSRPFAITLSEISPLWLNSLDIIFLFLLQI